MDGVEIKECCRNGADLKMWLKEAATYMVLVSRRASEQIKTLRHHASGKFIAASHPVVYKYRERAAWRSARRIISQLEA